MTQKKTEDKKIIDVAHPDTSAPSSSAKPIIVTNRPIMQDPMVVDKSTDQEEKPAPLPSKSSNRTVQPLAPPAAPQDTPAAAPAPQPEDPSTAPASEETAATPDKAEETSPAASTPQSDAKQRSEDKAKDPASDDKAAQEAAARELELQQLVESKKYFLPINSIEKRRTKRELALGVVLSLLLIAAWLDIALDAGLLHVAGIKAVTHFFSS